jgi:hypothetical protein
MATFRLAPIAEHAGHRDWAASTYRGVCHVGATSEEEARATATRAFWIASIVPLGVV